MTTNVISLKSEDKPLSDVAITLNHHLGIFDKWYNDPTINEISINDEANTVWLWRGGVWVSEYAPEITFDNLLALANVTSNFTDNQLDERNTSISGRLPDDSRIEITIPPGCPKDTIYLNIRKHSSANFRLQDFVRQDYFVNTKHVFNYSVPEAERERLYQYLSADQAYAYDLAKNGQWVEFITSMMELQGFNGLISGGMGTGKTTFLRSLVELISPKEVIITVEDTGEIPLPNHPNHKHLFFTRGQENKKTKMGATPKEALQTVLRKTPNRVILGELRGDEAFNFVQQVLNMGLNGTLSTIHANGSKLALTRLAGLIKSSEEGKSLSYVEIYELIYDLLHYVIQIKFDTEIERRSASEIYFDPIYTLYKMGI